jgi:hypothetical protein
MKSWKVRILGVSFAAAAMIFAISGLTATAQVVTYQHFDGYVCYDLDSDGLIDTCSTCFDTDGDGVVDTCYENESSANRIGKPIGSNGGPVRSNDPVNFGGRPVSFDRGPVNFSDSPVRSDEGPIGSGAGKGAAVKDSDDPIASDAGKRED